jgi:peptide/nickel transport system permease protein
MAIPASPTAAVESDALVGRRRVRSTRDFLARPLTAAAMTILVVTLVTAILGHAFAPHDPNAIDPSNILAGPSGKHVLGTDSLGRDNLSRVIYGTRIALEVAIVSVLGAFLVGGSLGLVGGYLGGWLDKVLVLAFDTLVAFPSVILALALLTLLGPSVANVTFVIAVGLTPYYGRLVRAQTLRERSAEYVKAERALGASRGRLLIRHIVPNILPPLLVIIAMDIPGAIAIEAGLAFIGLGVQPPTADWGVMLNDGFVDIGTSPWEIAGPIAALFLLTFAFSIVGEALRDVLDPRHTVTRAGAVGSGIRLGRGEG